jgi:uncharacterized membrane protein
MTSALRFALLIWLGSLFALLGLERFVFDPLRTGLATLALFLFEVLPILVCAPLAVRRPARGAFWVSLAALIYFTDGVVAAFDPDRRLLGAIEIVFALGTFVTALLLLRETRPEIKDP